MLKNLYQRFRILLSIFCAVAFPSSLQAQQTVFERSLGKETATYEEVVSFYQNLDQAYDMLEMREAGPTDAGYPLQLVLISKDRNFNMANWRAEGKLIVLINNGIHPGEPDGIDASMILAQDICQGRKSLPDNIVLAIIPVYNIGGCLNRNAYTRANQHGPAEYGFRGNAQNLDLNRDFSKCDSREAASFARLFKSLDPDIFIDTHVSDGADFQHVMTLISTQYDKLGEPVGRRMRDVYEPMLYEGMRKKGHAMIPYIDFGATDLKKGWRMFEDAPRYSSGFAAMFGTLAFMPETHMLKPYGQRVQATIDLLDVFLESASEKADTIKDIRKRWKEKIINQDAFAIQWKRDSSRQRLIEFRGYETDSSISKATGLKRMYYDHGRAYTKMITYYDGFQPAKTTRRPKAYIIPRGWPDVLDRLQWNGVKLDTLQRDTMLRVGVYHIADYQSSATPYEKHFRHRSVTLMRSTEELLCKKGDIIIFTNQAANNYIIQMLEPEADDSFFSWNFFDAILQAKEGYSDYRWDEIAAQVLATDSTLAKAVADRKKADPEFAKNHSAILYYIYKFSRYFEPAYRRYPVYRLETE